MMKRVRVGCHAIGQLCKAEGNIRSDGIPFETNFGFMAEPKAEVVEVKMKRSHPLEEASCNRVRVPEMFTSIKS